MPQGRKPKNVEFFNVLKELSYKDIHRFAKACGWSKHLPNRNSLRAGR